MANNYMDILYVPDYSPDAPLVMTPEIARALIVAHDEGRGMSDELLARARAFMRADDERRGYKHMTQSDWDKRDLADMNIYLGIDGWEG